VTVLKYDYRNFEIARLPENNIDRIQIAMIESGKRVLEIGCATGYMSQYLKEAQGCSVVGVELDPDLATEAALRCDHVILGGIDTLRVTREVDALVAKTGKFDVVFMSQVIEHIAEPLPVLSACTRWMSTGAALVISTCNIAHWTARLRLLRGKWDYDSYGIFDAGHLRFFTPLSMRRLLARAGFVVTQEGYAVSDVHLGSDRSFFARLTPSAFLRRLPFGLALSGWYTTCLRNLITYQFAYKAVRKAW
jgi:2-polyprenyl-3-methyl-5-hydroxy-6-metoxy-1,4-benzoquinol methylase